MSQLRQERPTGLWMCTELFTECPDCGKHIEEPGGDLEKFLDLIIEHENQEPPCTPVPPVTRPRKKPVAS